MLFILLYLIVDVRSTYVRVETSKGAIIGEKYDGYNLFLGVPYALVDTTHPFGNCLNYPDFVVPFKANKKGILCPQIINSIYHGSLQCLTLNIYVPQTVHTNLPVLAWFHGENFWNGDANDYHSSHLVKHDIIFISVNYRLGPYGFLCPDLRDFPANQGLRDQVAALRWIKENIGAFAGDASAVTIAGAGYAGSFVDLHLYTKPDEGLFDKAIIQSGSIFSNGFFVPPTPQYYREIGKYLQPTINAKTRPADILAFLNKIESYKILEVAGLFNYKLGICKESFPGKNDKYAITGNPFQLDIKDKVLNTKILIGYNSMELLSLYAKNNTNLFYMDAGDVIYNELVKNFKVNKHILSKLAYIIKTFYFGDKDYSPKTILQLVAAISDFNIGNGVERTINRLAKAGAVIYKYLFSYTGASEITIKGAGAPMYEELKYLLDYNNSEAFDSEQKTVRKHMVQMWANFVKYGYPTPDNGPVTWTPIHGLTRPYLNIDREITMEEDVLQRRNAFWYLVWFQYQNRSILY